MRHKKHQYFGMKIFNSLTKHCKFNPHFLLNFKNFNHTFSLFAFTAIIQALEHACFYRRLLVNYQAMSIIILCVLVKPGDVLRML